MIKWDGRFLHHGSPGLTEYSFKVKRAEMPLSPPISSPYEVTLKSGEQDPALRPDIPHQAPSIFIVGFWYDWIFFIGSPLIAVVIALSAQSVDWLQREVSFLGVEESPIQVFLGTLIMSHLFLVFYRSHLNPQIVGQFKFRFFIVPPLLVIAMVTSAWVAVCCSVLATWWDVYHSSLQTFGLGRIYDARIGNYVASDQQLPQGFRD